jgi:hypothetical protein
VEGVTSIGDSAFYNCIRLSSVTIPGSVASIGEYAFRNCGLSSVTIGGSVTSIGDGAFSECSNLTSVIFGAGSNITTAWNDNSFPNNYYGGSTGYSLWTAYNTANKAGAYTRSGSIWTKTLPPGSATQDKIAITFWVNTDDQILASNSSVTISKTSAENNSFTAEAVNGPYNSVTWSVNGAVKATSGSVTINAVNYNTGTYRLGVIVVKGGAPYSTEITFIVTD